MALSKCSIAALQISPESSNNTVSDRQTKDRMRQEIKKTLASTLGITNRTCFESEFKALKQRYEDFLKERNENDNSNTEGCAGHSGA